MEPHTIGKFLHIKEPSKTVQELREAIDTDTQLHKSRNLFLLASIILLTTSVSGAKIEEANTFIFKISIENTESIGYLLIGSVIFLCIRYYSCTINYHYSLSEQWRYRLVSNETITKYRRDISEEPDSDSVKISGISFDIWNKTPIELSFQRITVEKYTCKFPLRRYFEYSEILYKETGCSQELYNHKKINILIVGGIRTYLKVLSIEFSERIKSLLEYRENLDLLAPYFIAFCAIGAYLAKQYNFI